VSRTAPTEGDLADVVGERVRARIDRAVQRNIKGLEYFASSAPPVGVTPRDEIYTRGTMHVFHYHPRTDEIYRVPVLAIVPPTNRGYILDLAPKQSFIEFMLDRGFDVFMLEFSPPTKADKRLRVDDYILDFIPEAIARVQEDSGESDISLIGYCAAGMMSACYAALNQDGPLKNLICFTTPIDFQEMKLFATLSDKRFMDVDRLVDSVGNVPAEFIIEMFALLRPASRIADNLRLLDNLWNDEYVKSYRRFERWSNETMPLPGEYVRQWTKDFFWENKLVKNEFDVGGRRVLLSNVRVPLLHVVAEHDHIVTRGASKPLIEMVGSEEKEEVVLKGGHVSIAAGPNASRRMWPKVDAWLSERSV
jgi:polyhydroxyalkanoate synthase